jgi:hypothetical protein
MELLLLLYLFLIIFYFQNVFLGARFELAALHFPHSEAGTPHACESESGLPFCEPGAVADFEIYAGQFLGPTGLLPIEYFCSCEVL